MGDKPIIFSAPMVRALLDGRKAQTRRVLKPQPEYLESSGRWKWSLPPKTRRNVAGGSVVTGSREFWEYAPNGSFPYAVGDRLYVREAFVTGFDIDDEYSLPTGDKKVWYRSTDSNLTWYDPDTESTLDNPPWKPSIHMPRWASRLTLTVTDVRVQRLQEISDEDAQAEGMAPLMNPEPVEAFRTLWNSLHGPDAWDANPWVVAVSFSVQHGNIDQIGGTHD